MAVNAEDLKQMSTEEFNQAVYTTILREFGIVGLARFIRDNFPGQGDYTQERRRWADSVTYDELAKAMDELDMKKYRSE